MLSKLLIDERLEREGRKYYCCPNTLSKLKLVRLLLDPVECPAGNMEIQRFRVRSHAVNLEIVACLTL